MQMEDKERTKSSSSFACVMQVPLMIRRAAKVLRYVLLIAVMLAAQFLGAGAQLAAALLVSTGSGYWGYRRGSLSASGERMLLHRHRNHPPTWKDSSCDPSI